jgi:hypothetical protein
MKIYYADASILEKSSDFNYTMPVKMTSVYSNQLFFTVKKENIRKDTFLFRNLILKQYDLIIITDSNNLY